MVLRRDEEGSIRGGGGTVFGDQGVGGDQGSEDKWERREIRQPAVKVSES